MGGNYSIEKAYQKYDGIFLYANDSVLDFYPKFGFESACEYQFTCKVSQKAEYTARPVSLITAKERAEFLQNKNKCKSMNKTELFNDDLLMFYLTSVMSECVYYLDDKEAYIIAEKENNRLILHEIFYKKEIELEDVYHAFGEEVEEVIFTFTPKIQEGLVCSAFKAEDSTLFVLGNRLKDDLRQILRFPELSHA